MDSSDANDIAVTLKQMQDIFYMSALNIKGQRDVFKIDNISILNIRKWAANKIIALQQSMKQGISPLKTADAENQINIEVSLDSNVATQTKILPAPPILSIPRTFTVPKIDGVLDESQWEKASKVSIPASAPTNARIMSDENNIYVAWECNEPKMNRMIPLNSQNDFGPVWSQDSVELFLAPYNAKYRMAHIMINHLGRWTSENNSIKDWDARSQVVTKHYKDKYVVEMALPWKSLSEIAPLPWKTASLNLCRVRNPDIEIFGTSKFNWAYGTGNFHQPDKFGLALLENYGAQVIETSSKISKNNKTLTINAKIRNIGINPIWAKIIKIKDRNLCLLTEHGIISGGTKIFPGHAEELSIVVDMASRRMPWNFQWNLPTQTERSKSIIPFKVPFDVPGKTEINTFSLDIKQLIVLDKTSNVKITPIIAANAGKFIQMSSENYDGPIMPVESLRNGKNKYFMSMKRKDNALILTLKLLDSDKSVLSDCKVTIINLEK